MWYYCGKCVFYFFPLESLSSPQVPVFPPDPRKLKKDLHHFMSIQSSSGAKVVLTHSLYNIAKNVSQLKNLFSTSSVGWPDLNWIQIDSVLKKGKDNDNTLYLSNKSKLSKLVDNIERNIAFLQYTSGSTSDPKGVMISHDNLSHNLQSIVNELKANTETVNVSW